MSSSNAPSRLRHKPWIGYAVAVASVLLAVAARSMLYRVFGHWIPFITFFPAVMLAAALGGLRAGLLATVLSVALSLPMFRPHEAGGPRVGTARDALIIALFVACSLMLVMIAEALRRARLRVADLAERYQAAEQRARNVLESITDAFYVVDRDFRVSWVNHQCELHFGKTRQDMVGRDIFDLFPGSREAKIGEELRAAMSLGVARHAELLGPYTGKWLEVRLYPSPEGVAVYFHDISDRKRAEEALRASEDDFRAMFELAAVGTCTVDAINGRFVRVNRRLCQILGYEEPELVGRPYLDYVHPDDRHDSHLRFVALANEEVPTCSAALRLLRRNGEVAWTDTAASVLRDAQGVPYRILATFQDVTDRRRAQEELASVTSHVRCILWHGPVAGRSGWEDPNHPDLFAWDLAVQDERTAQLVLPLETRPGEPYFKALLRARDPEDEVRMRLNAFAALRRGDKAYSQEFRATDRSGKQHWLYEVVTLRQEAYGKWQAFGVITDISDNKRAEAERTELLAREQRARAEAEAANRRKDQFLAVLSHELRTPLTPVLARVALLKRDRSLPPHVVSGLEMIRRNVDLEARLIDDLLDITRIARGSLELHFDRVDAHEKLNDALEIYRAEIDAKRLQLIVELNARQHFVRADPARLQQIFWNLISNAVKYTPPEGAITIRSSNVPAGDDIGRATDAAAGTLLRVEVSDTGVGIEPEVMERLFKPFEQGEQVLTRRFGGLGLGLSITKTLVERHGGTLRPYSEGFGRGATLTVELPAFAAVPAGAEAPPTEPVAAPPPAGQGKRILLVEDNPDTLSVMARVLRSAGYEVDTAADVKGALAIDGGFDLLLSDIGLPDGTGWELMRKLRQRGPVRGIALSGFSMDDDIARSRDVGFVNHLCKPINPDELEDAIRRALDEPVAPALAGAGA